jgi:glutamate synthase (NADPH/NADH) small chain
VPIRAIEQFLSEYAFAHGQIDASTAPPNGLRVAVVGSGPGGLACAEDLAKKGYAVAVFDSAMVPGGLLVNGVPAFKVERSVVQRRIEILMKRGVVFHLGAKLNENLTLGGLRADFDAVFLGFDSRKARPFDLPGADLQGVVQALPFILHKSTPLPLEIPQLDVSGTRVAVLGAGDTAMDCLRTAIRCGAREVTCVYRREEADMPCSRREYENAVEEGARFLFRAAPVAVLANDRGGVAGLRLVRTELGLADSEGPRPFLIQAGTEFELQADWVVPALGFEPLPCPRSDDFSDLAVNDWGGLVVDGDQMTTLPGVFAGGDIVRGPSLVLHAVRDGRRAAAGIHAHLSARTAAVTAAGGPKG